MMAIDEKDKTGSTNWGLKGYKDRGNYSWFNNGRDTGVDLPSTRIAPVEPVVPVSFIRPIDYNLSRDNKPASPLNLGTGGTSKDSSDDSNWFDDTLGNKDFMGGAAIAGGLAMSALQYPLQQKMLKEELKGMKLANEAGRFTQDTRVAQQKALNNAAGKVRVPSTGGYAGLAQQAVQ